MTRRELLFKFDFADSRMRRRGMLMGGMQMLTLPVLLFDSQALYHWGTLLFLQFYFLTCIITASFPPAVGAVVEEFGRFTRRGRFFYEVATI